MTALVSGSASGDDPPAATTLAEVPRHALVSGVPESSVPTSPAIDRVSGDEPCYASGGRLLYVGLDTWIPAQPMFALCPQNVP